MECFAGVLKAVPGGFGVYLHPAHGIDHHDYFICNVSSMGVCSMLMVMMFVHGASP